MFYSLQEQLSLSPYSASFFFSLTNQEYVDDKVPELTHLRTCLKRINLYDFAMIHEESAAFHSLKQEIV
jgi:hypothetical protein